MEGWGKRFGRGKKIAKINILGRFVQQLVTSARTCLCKRFDISQLWEPLLYLIFLKLYSIHILASDICTDWSHLCIVFAFHLKYLSQIPFPEEGLQSFAFCAKFNFVSTTELGTAAA